MKINIEMDDQDLNKLGYIAKILSHMNSALDRTEPIIVAPNIETEEKKKRKSRNTKPEEDNTDKDSNEEVTKNEPVEENSIVTFQELRKKLMELKQKGKPIKELLINEVGVRKLSDIKEEDYADVLKKAEAL